MGRTSGGSVGAGATGVGEVGEGCAVGGNVGATVAASGAWLPGVVDAKGTVGDAAKAEVVRVGRMLGADAAGACPVRNSSIHPLSSATIHVRMTPLRVSPRAPPRTARPLLAAVWWDIVHTVARLWSIWVLGARHGSVAVCRQSFPHHDTFCHNLINHFLPDQDRLT